MNFVRIAASAALLAAAAGCAVPDFSPSKLGASQFADASRGVVLVSTGAVERCVGAAMWAPIYVASTETLVPDHPLLPIDATRQSDFADHFGTLSAVSLPPGRYIITAEWANPVSEPTSKVPAWSFDVVAGQSVYIGEIWRTTPCQLSANLVLRDSYERDVALAEKFNTHFITQPPRKALGSTLHNDLVGRQTKDSIPERVQTHGQVMRQ
ncbi:MAG: hypothetical protein ACJ8G1_17655 [Vitreoscilla sp.]